MSQLMNLSDDKITEMYNALRAAGNQAGAKREAKQATKWNPSEFQTASGYAIRVAQNSTLTEFKEFAKTGQPVHAVKMTPAEMEVLMGGSRTTDWIVAGAAVVAAGAAFVCA